MENYMEDDLEDVNISVGVSVKSVISKLSATAQIEFNKALRDGNTNKEEVFRNVSESSKQEFMKVSEYITKAVAIKLRECDNDDIKDGLMLDFINDEDDFTLSVEKLVDDMLEEEAESSLNEVVESLTLAEEFSEYNFPYAKQVALQKDALEFTLKTLKSIDEDTLNKVRLMVSVVYAKLQKILDKDCFEKAIFGLQLTEAKSKNKKGDTRQTVVLSVALCTLGIVIVVSDISLNSYNIMINGEHKFRYVELPWKYTEDIIDLLQRANNARNG